MKVAGLPVVGVMGSGTEAHLDKAEPLGRWLATLRVHLLTGGGGGVMQAVSRAFAGVRDRRGLVIGVLPAGPEPGAASDGYPNPWVDLAVRTHLPLRGSRGSEAMSRNHINVLSSDVVVALPGGAGTATEVQLAVGYGTPIVAFVSEAGDIPALPPSVPVASDLESVQRFVLQAL